MRQLIPSPVANAMMTDARAKRGTAAPKTESGFCVRRRYQAFARLILAGLACIMMGCHSAMPTTDSTLPPRDINAVLADHDRQLLAVPGVVGVYVGLLDDQKTPCLKVMLALDDPQLRPVLLEVTGEIRPLRP
jgi:hypothetical protein